MAGAILSKNEAIKKMNIIVKAQTFEERQGCGPSSLHIANTLNPPTRHSRDPPKLATAPQGDVGIAQNKWSFGT